MIEFSFKVFRCQTKAQTISEHCVFQKCSNKKIFKNCKKGPKTTKKNHLKLKNSA